MLNELLIKELSNKVDVNTSDIKNIKDAEVYSTNEVKTNKVYIDENGKEWPIYKNTFKGNIPQVRIEIDISNLNVNHMIDLYGWMDTSSYSYVHVPVYNNSQTNHAMINNAKTKIIADFGWNNPKTYTLYFFYTKTTD